VSEIALNWRVERGQLNHNWLQNSVLVGARHALSILDGRVRTTNLIQILKDDVWRWRERNHELTSLLSRFEEEMSPKTLFCQLPLSRCSDQTKEWLVPLIHDIWLHRHNVRERIREIEESYRRAEKSFVNLSIAIASVPETCGIQDVRDLRPLFTQFADSCENLATGISSLPHELQCC
jgi:hypothetical protein